MPADPLPARHQHTPSRSPVIRTPKRAHTKLSHYCGGDHREPRLWQSVGRSVGEDEGQDRGGSECGMGRFKFPMDSTLLMMRTCCLKKHVISIELRSRYCSVIFAQ